MYVLDQAIVGGRTNNFINNTIKLLKIDLKTDTLLYVYRFPYEVANEHSFLNDLVIDRINNFIYITDSGINVN